MMTHSLLAVPGTVPRACLQTNMTSQAKRQYSLGLAGELRRTVVEMSIRSRQIAERNMMWMCACRSNSRLPISSCRLTIVLLSIGITLLFHGGRPVEAFVPFVTSLLQSNRPRQAVSDVYHILFSDPAASPFVRSKSRVRHLYMASSSTTSKANIVYQKIVRPPADVPPAQFLGNLVEYLQDRFQLPANLPMVYKSQPDTCDVLSWDSPLSPCSSETRMNVQVVGIYTDDDKSVLVPNLAMVVVSKDPKPPTGRVAPMMQNLFLDSEKRILRALDRGLDEVQQGTIVFSSGATTVDNLKSVEEAIHAEIIEDRTASQSFGGGMHPIDVVVDTTAKSDDSSSSSSSTVRDIRASSRIGEDYAVSAAKQAVARRTLLAETKESASKTSPTGDYAVDAAKRAATSRLGEKITTGPKVVSTTSLKTRDDERMVRSGGPRRITISTPKQHAERKSAASRTAAAKKSNASNPIIDGLPLEKTKKVIQNGSSKNTITRGKVETLLDADTLGKKTRVPKAAKGNITIGATKPSTDDYAVDAAKRAAASRIGEKMTTGPKVVSTSSLEARDDERKVRSEGSGRITILTPKQHAERKVAASSRTTAAKKSNARNPVIDGLTLEKKKKVVQNGSLGDTITRGKVDSLADADTLLGKGTRIPDAARRNETVGLTKGAKISTKRSINLRVHETNDTGTTEAELMQPFETMLEQGTETNAADAKQMVSQSEMERDVMEAAKDVMSEISSQGVDMSPEELLRDVMTFGEEQDQENAVGRGFVSGAFEKAKELLREQKQRRVQRLSKEKGVKDMSKSASGMRLDILDPDDHGDKKSVLTAEEELKRIFEAGERLADGRIGINKYKSSDSAMTDADLKDQELVDALIASDKTVSAYARSLDDELTELEVRLNKSPGEELDGPVKNPLFDIFSGPEVYNPNVDAETAVNWPGALPGTKELRLPKELDEAVKQAKFAAEVITKMNEVQGANGPQFFLGDRELTSQQVENLRAVLNEAVEIGLIRDPLEYLQERSRLQMVVDELWNQPDERFRDISSSFMDLLLSDNFVALIKERLEAMADRDLDARRRDDDSLEENHARERVILSHLVESAQLLLKEVQALGAELEASQLEVVRSICQVAMDPSHQTEEETAAALTDAVRDMRPLLDNTFVAYLKYAIAEEEGRLARAGHLDDPHHNEWLFVLKIVQQGVYTEISRGINRYIEHIWYVLRMETKTERRMLLSKIIDKLPTMDVRPFVQVIDNIVASLGGSAQGEFDGFNEIGEMTNKLLQLHRDVKELLPPERIQSMSRDADEWAAKQKKLLQERRKVTQQRLQASRDTTDYDDEIRRRGEIERIT